MLVKICVGFSKLFLFCFMFLKSKVLSVMIITILKNTAYLLWLQNCSALFCPVEFLVI